MLCNCKKGMLQPKGFFTYNAPFYSDFWKWCNFIHPFCNHPLIRNRHPWLSLSINQPFIGQVACQPKLILLLDLFLALFHKPNYFQWHFLHLISVQSSKGLRKFQQYLFIYFWHSMPKNKVKNVQCQIPTWCKSVQLN